jgi:D-3-phosphoglycerate dehydrogenase / 2-oxoglutarate reductase
VSELIAIVSRVNRSVPGWDDAIAEGRSAGYEVFEAIGNGTTLETLPDEVRARAVGVVISTEPCTDDVMEEMPSLRVVSCIGTGLDHVDLNAAATRGVQILSGDGANAEAVADHTLAMMLSLVRGLGVVTDRVLAGEGWTPWPPVIPRDMKGLTVGILGFGKIGRAVAARVSAFGSAIVFHDPFLGAAPTGLRAAPVAFDQLFEGADVVTVHVPLSAATRGLVGEREIAALKPGSILLNLSRGGIVDEQAALRALAEGQLSGLGLDVWEAEGPGMSPPPRDPRLVASPHMGGISDRIARETRVAAVRRMVAALEGDTAATTGGR